MPTMLVTLAASSNPSVSVLQAAATMRWSRSTLSGTVIGPAGRPASGGSTNWIARNRSG